MLPESGMLNLISFKLLASSQAESHPDPEIT